VEQAILNTDTYQSVPLIR